MLQKNIRVWMLAFLPLFGSGIWSLTLPGHYQKSQLQATEVQPALEDSISEGVGEVIGHLNGLWEEEDSTEAGWEVEAVWQAEQQAPMEPGQLRFNTMNYSFPRVAAGTKVRYAFEIQNLGSQLLTIDYIEVKHPQLNYFLREKDILPGGQTLLEVVFRTESLPGFHLLPIKVYVQGSPVPYFLTLEGTVS